MSYVMTNFNLKMRSFNDDSEINKNSVHDFVCTIKSFICHDIKQDMLYQELTIEEVNLIITLLYY